MFNYWLYSTDRSEQSQITRERFAQLLKIARPCARFPMWSRTYEIADLGLRIQVTKS